MRNESFELGFLRMIVIMNERVNDGIDSDEESWFTKKKKRFMVKKRNR